MVLEDGEKVWQFTGMDLVSRYGLGSIHTRATAGLAARFFKRWLDEAPTPRPLPYGVVAMQQELEWYLAYSNTRRSHMAPGGLAHMEFTLKEGGPQSRMY